MEKKNDFLYHVMERYAYEEWKNPSKQEQNMTLMSSYRASKVQQFSGYQMESCQPCEGLAGSYFSRYRSLINPEQLIYAKVVLCTDARGARRRLLYALAEKAVADIQRVETTDDIAFEKKSADGYMKLWCEGNVFKEIRICELTN